MLVTVVGSSGVLGRRVVGLLLERGHDVRALARSRASARRLPAGCAVVGDPWDEGFLRVALAGADAATMLATAIPEGPAALLPRSWRTNDQIRSQLAPMVARIARESGVRTLVQESVLFVYPDSGPRWVEESAPLRPARQAASCLSAEFAAREFQADGDSGRRAVILRFGLFAAPDSGLSRQTWQMATRGRALVLGDLGGYTTQIHAADAAQAVVHALGGEVPGGTYNACAEPSTRGAWLESLSQVVGRAVVPPPSAVRVALPRIAPTAEALARSIRLDSSLLVATGWEPEYPDVEAIWRAVGAGLG